MACSASAAEPPPTAPYRPPEVWIRSLVNALPRSASEAPAQTKERVEGELEVLALVGPRNGLEAVYAVQFVAFSANALAVLARANAGEATEEALRRALGTASGLQRAAERARRALVQEQRVAGPVVDGAAVVRGWGYDTAALAEGMRVPVAAPVVQRVPLWKQAGKRYMHEISNEELKELSDALKRGEPMEEPPYRPGDPAITFKVDPNSFRPYVRWEDLTMEERRERWGYRHPEEIAAEKAAAGKGDGGETT